MKKSVRHKDPYKVEVGDFLYFKVPGQEPHLLQGVVLKVNKLTFDVHFWTPFEHWELNRFRKKITHRDDNHNVRFHKETMKEDILKIDQDEYHPYELTFISSFDS